MSGAWPTGDYQLDIRRDGAATSCRFEVPGDLPAHGSLKSFACGSSVRAMLAQRAECTTTTLSGDTVSQACTPIEDQYDLKIEIRSTPQSLRTVLTRDGEVVVDDSRDLTYGELDANGPGCGPTCRQASVELVVD